MITLKRINKTSATVLEQGDKEILYSYSTPVAFTYRSHNGVIFVTSKKWSVTTSRHINKWMSQFVNSNITLVDQCVLEDMIGGNE